MIEPADITRLVRETAAYAEREGSDDPVSAWCAREDISNAAMLSIGDNIWAVVRSSILEGIRAGRPQHEDVVSNIQAAILLGFTIGWEAHKQYGKPRDM